MPKEAFSKLTLPGQNRTERRGVSMINKWKRFGIVGGFLNSVKILA